MRASTTAQRRPEPDPLTTAPPSFSLEDASALATRLFGVTGTPSPLDSERDQNFRLMTDGRESFLLKISNPADEEAAIEMQTLAMLHIAGQDLELPVMQPLRTLEGHYYTPVGGPKGETYWVRLLTFCPGRTVRSTELGPDALRGFGAMVARMGLALRGFFHPAGGYRILWDLKHTPALRPMLETVDDIGHRRVAERVLNRFDESVSPFLPGLRGQLIHNDLTLDNVLLDDSHRTSGIVDFGDLTHTALVCDLAIALVSLMWGRPDPVDAAKAAIQGYTSVTSLEEGEAVLLADLAAARLTALALIASWRVRRYPENADYITANVNLAWELLERFEDLGPLRIQELMRSACLHSPPLSTMPAWPSLEALFERRRRALGPALSSPSYDRPLYLVRAEGSRMFDHQGNAYLDAYNNVPVVGHCHPEVTAAIADQSATLNTNTRYLHESVVELAERLVATMPEGLDTVMFLNSGSEANDVAWRLATAYTGRAGGIVTARAYHGITAATLALSPEEWLQGERPTDVETVPAPDDYRGPYRRQEPDWTQRYALHVEQALANLEARGIAAAAFYVDSLFASDGIFRPPASYLEEVASRLRAAGCLLVADEVQGGFGRTGSHLWSFQQSAITPDFVTLGKPMGNGHPVAAVVTRSEIAERFAIKSDMFSTFGGNPVACRAALAVLDVLERERLMERAADVGSHLRRNLERLMTRHETIGDVRGAGLMIGVELVQGTDAATPAPRLAHYVMNHMKERGVLVGITGPDANVLKIRPPLVVTVDEADVISKTLDASLSDAADLGLHQAGGNRHD